MCILLVSTQHPVYPLVLLSNRDEFLARKAKTADWWDAPHSNVLAGRDLQHPSHGTWLGVTKQGRLAILTNYREEYNAADTTTHAARSRGEITKSYLTALSENNTTGFDPDGWARDFLSDDGFKGHVIGGFSFAFAVLRKRDIEMRGTHQTQAFRPFRIISNRTSHADEIEVVDRDTWGLSNTHYSDRSWSKVLVGEELLQKAVENDASKHISHNHVNAQENKDAFIEQLFAILAVDNMPPKDPQQDWKDYAANARNSIFIPPVGTDTQSLEAGTAPASGTYGTRTQTVVLVEKSGIVTFVEKTLYNDAKERLSSERGVQKFEFHIDGWDESPR